MKLNNIGYLLKEGFRSIFQHGFMSFAAICVTVACLIIVGSFSALAYNLDIMVQDLNKTSEIMVYIDSDLSDAEARSIGTKINLLDNVFDAKYVSREEALQNFVSDHDNDSAFSGVQPQDLRHRYVVTLEDNTKMQQTADLLGKRLALIAQRVRLLTGLAVFLVQRHDLVHQHQLLILELLANVLLYLFGVVAEQIDVQHGKILLNIVRASGKRKSPRPCLGRWTRVATRLAVLQKSTASQAL